MIFVSHEIVLILDFGGQYNQLIARRVRDMGIYCEIMPWRKATVEAIKEKNPIGIIFTGGPNSCYEPDSPTYSKEIFELFSIYFWIFCSTKFLGIAGDGILKSNQF